MEDTGRGRVTGKDGDEVVIEARDLRTHFRARVGLLGALVGGEAPVVRALDGVDIAIRMREIVGLVGESGCGKSTFGMTLVRMHEPTSGVIRFRGDPITHVSAAELKRYRARAQIIFQDPYSSLNPRLTVGQVIEEPLRIHRVGTAEERRQRVVRTLDYVRMPAEEYIDRYPSDLSGGQRQRVAIARALVLEPDFIVADEPVSMLDVSVQAGVLELLDDLSRRLGLAVLYISHDIATVGYICDRVGVMYLGRVVEEGATDRVLQEPLHPYTEALMAAIPDVDPAVRRARVELAGEVPSPLNVPPGCRFATRCPHASGLCHAVEPDLVEVAPDHRVRCHLYPGDGPTTIDGHARPTRRDPAARASGKPPAP